MSQGRARIYFDIESVFHDSDGDFVHVVFGRDAHAHGLPLCSDGYKRPHCCHLVMGRGGEGGGGSPSARRQLTTQPGVGLQLGRHLQRAPEAITDKASNKPSAFFELSVLWPSLMNTKITQATQIKGGLDLWETSKFPAVG